MAGEGLHRPVEPVLVDERGGGGHRRSAVDPKAVALVRVADAPAGQGDDPQSEAVSALFAGGGYRQVVVTTAESAVCW